MLHYYSVKDNKNPTLSQLTRGHKNKDDKMEENNSKIELIKAMVKFQAEVGVISKGCEGQSGHRKFKYADLANIWEAISGPLSENGLWVYQYMQQHEENSHLHTDLYHVSGACLSSDCKIDYTATDIKDFGGNISYYRRYALLAVLGLVTDDNVEDKPQNTYAKKVDSPKTVPLEPLKKLRDEVSASRAKLTYNRKKLFDERLQELRVTISTASEKQLLEFQNGLSIMLEKDAEEKRNVA